MLCSYFLWLLSKFNFLILIFSSFIRLCIEDIVRLVYLLKIHNSLFYLFIFFVELSWGTLWHLQKSLQYIKYIILEFHPSTFILLSFILLSHHSWNNYKRNNFSIYITVYTVFVLCSPSYILSLPPPTPHLPLVPTPPGRTKENS
jgi:hypothetical protein